MPKDNEAPVEVIQGDRDAAKTLSSAVWILDADHDTLVAHFARHRLAYQSEAPAQGEGDNAKLRADLAKFDADFSCEGCGAPLFDGDDFVSDPDSCHGCWATMTDVPSSRPRPCYAYRVGKLDANAAAPATIAKNAAVALPLADREAIARGDADIVLVSQDRVNPLGYQLHGLFYSFADAARHVAKDAQLTAEQETALIEGWGGLSDRYESAEVGVWWVAARQPTRSPAILALSGSLPPSPVGEGI